MQFPFTRSPPAASYPVLTPVHAVVRLSMVSPAAFLDFGIDQIVAGKKCAVFRTIIARPVLPATICSHRALISSSYYHASRDRTAMKLLDRLLRTPPPITDRAGLADFIDSQAAFITQKGIYEYSRARAGHYAKVLFAEPGFAASVEHARWQAFPLGLAMVGEAAEVALRPHAASQRRAVLDRQPSPSPRPAPSATTPCSID